MVTCFYCDAPLFSREETKDMKDREKRRAITLTRDHAIPKHLTRNNSNPTIVIACDGCNNDKNRLTIEEYRVVQAFRRGYVSGVELKFPGEEQ